MSVIKRSIMTLGENLFCGYWKFSKLKLEYYFLFLFTNQNNYKSLKLQNFCIYFFVCNYLGWQRLEKVELVGEKSEIFH